MCVRLLWLMTFAYTSCQLLLRIHKLLLCICKLLLRIRKLLLRFRQLLLEGRANGDRIENCIHGNARQFLPLVQGNAQLFVVISSFS